jgi:uroporphyrinogen decarboxylase
MYETVKAHGKKVIIHCCGKVDEILPELIELGVDLFNPFQPEVMDVYRIKKQFGGEIGFWGGISTQQLLPFGTPEQVREEVRRLLDKIGRDGGYIAAPAHAIPGDAKPENIDAMIEVLNGQ